MKQFIFNLRQSTFLRHNAIFFAGSVAVGALNYLYYPIVGRLLQPAAFGEVQVLVSLFLQLTIFLSVLGLVTINLVANYRDKARRNETVFELEKFALIVAVIILFATFLAAEPLRQFFHFQSSWPFILLAAALVVTVPFTFRTAYLRGVQRFTATSIANVIGAGSKIIFSVFLVIIGLGTAGAIAGLALAQGASLGYAAWQSRASGLIRPQNLTRFALPKLNAILPELRYSTFVLLGTLGVMVLFSIDVLIVKRFFDPHTAGLYAGVATVARIIFFVTASISQVLLPSVKIDQPARQNRQLFIKSAILLTGISSPILLMCFVVPEHIISLLMGKAYLTHTGLLPLLALTMFVISILNLTVLYFLALRRYAPAVFAIIGAGATCVLLLINHSTLESVVHILLYGSIAIVCFIAVWAFAKNLKRGNSAKAAAHIHHHSDL